MQVSQQVDALVTMGVNPFRKLITPRIIAGLFMLPALTFVHAAAAIFAGGLVARFSGEMSFSFFLKQSLGGIAPGDLLWGMTKSTVFGFVVVALACYFGVRITGGTAGVRKSAAQSAVAGLLLVLVLDFLLTSFARSL